MKKIQMTEEQAREISKLLLCSDKCSKYPSGCDECGFNILKDNGYIYKSELEALVEYTEHLLDILSENPTKYILIKSFQALKSEVNRLGGKI